MSKERKVLVVSDCPLLRAGVRMVLGQLPFITAVEQCTPSEALEAGTAGSAHIMVLDIDQADDLANEDLRSLWPEPWRLIVVTASNTSTHIAALYAAGAGAVVHKAQPISDFMAAVETVEKGDIWIRRSVFPSVMKTLHHNGADKTEGGRISTLTKRERDIIQGIGKGCRNKQIASDLCLSEATVRHHLTAIFGKLEVSDRLELLLYAQKQGLLTASNGMELPSKQLTKTSPSA